MTEMSPGFALFNSHVNNARERASALMTKYFPSYLERVRELEAEGNGMMHILNVPPEPATTAYLALVTAFVNEKSPSTYPATETPIKVGDKAFASAGFDDTLRLTCVVEAEVEGWFQVRFRDDSTAVVRPSRLSPRE